MKKLLLSTAAVFAFASSVNAADPDLTVGGYVNAQGGFVDSDTIENDQHALRVDSEVHVEVGGEHGDLAYGAVIELEADSSEDSDNIQNNNINADKSYLFLQGDFGRVELGSNTDASDALDINTGTFARATGGVDGDFYKFAAPTTNAIIRPDGAIAHDRAAAEDANRITLYTARQEGVQLGVSYTPDLGTHGQAVALGNGTPSGVDSRDGFSGGVNYASNFDGFGVAASATAEYANSQAAMAKDTFTHKYGLQLTTEGVTLGGSYGKIDEGLGGQRDGEYFDVGVAYETGPFGASVTYLDSEASTNGVDTDFTNIVIGADYAYAPGAAAYAEVSLFEEDTAGVSNDGTVVLLGTQVGF